MAKRWSIQAMADRETVLTYTLGGDIALDRLALCRPAVTGPSSRVGRWRAAHARDRAVRSRLGRAGFTHCALRDVAPGEETTASGNATITTLAHDWLRQLGASADPTRPAAGQLPRRNLPHGRGTGRKAMTIRMGFADTSGGQVHYRFQPGTGVPLVFFHQTASSGRMWLKTFARLPGRACYAFDTPGFGGSFDPDPDSRPPMSQYAQWMAEAVAALELGSVHVVSHHTGACIAVEAVARGLIAARSLTMIGPVPLTAEERLEFSRHFGAPFTPVTSGAYLLDNWDYLRRLGADADVMLFHREMADQLRAWWGRVQAYNAVWGQDFAGFLRDVRTPLLLLAAPDDVLYPFLERALAMRPDARSFPLAGANFEPDLDPDSFAQGLASFLADVEAGRA